MGTLSGIGREKLVRNYKEILGCIKEGLNSEQLEEKFKSFGKYRLKS